MNNISFIQRIQGLTDMYREAEYNFAYWNDAKLRIWRASFLEIMSKLECIGNDYDYYMQLKRFLAILENGHNQIIVPAYIRRKISYLPAWIERINEDYYYIESCCGRLISYQLIAVENMLVDEFFDKFVFPYCSSRGTNGRMLEASSIFTSSYTIKTKTLLVKQNNKLSEKLVHHTSSKDFTYKRFAIPAKKINLSTLKIRDSSYSAYYLPEGVTFIDVRSFDTGISDEFFERLQELLLCTHTCIIDIRNNLGGSSLNAYELACVFIPVESCVGYDKYSVYYSRDFRNVAEFSKDNDRYTKNVTHRLYETNRLTLGNLLSHKSGKMVFRGRVFILQNRYTASSAEDFIMAMASASNVTTVGEDTFGSTGQAIQIPLPQNGFCQICNRMCLDHLGVSINNIGISPDIRFEPKELDLNDRDVLMDYILKECRLGG